MNDSAYDHNSTAPQSYIANIEGASNLRELCDDADDDGLMQTEETKLLPGISSRDQYNNADERSNGRNVYTFEESLTAVGTGKFHFFLLLLCGWAVSSDAVEVLSVSFLLPSATCDLHLSSEDKGWLNAIVFVGMMVGGLFWGAMADHSGRRSVLMWSLTVNGLGGLLSSVSQVFWLFLIFRLISGIGVGGSIPVIFTYFTEFQAKARRGSMISVLATFWMAGNILAAGLAWIVIPHSSLGFFSPDFKYNSWRIFIALCTIPSLTSAAIFVLMPESPKFLLKVGKEDQAIMVLKKVHRSNKSRNYFHITSLVLTGEEAGQVNQKDGGMEDVAVKHSRGWLKSIFDNTVELFRPHLFAVTCVLLVVNFTIAFGYYGLFMWFPEIFNRIDKNGGTLCEPGYGSNDNSSASSNSTGCEVVGDIVYLEGFLTALSNLPGNVLTIFLMDRIGRKILLASSMVISGVSVFFLWFVHERWQSILMSCIFGAVSTVGFNALDVLQAELFPTDVRSTAFGVQTGLARIAAILGNVAFGLLVDVNCAVPMILIASLMSFGGLISIKLPNTTGMDIH